MLRRYNRLLVAIHVVADALSAATAFLLAYYVRFESSFAQLIPVTKGQPPLEHYLMLTPFLAVMVPLAFHVQGLYRLRRGRTRVDDFFAVLVGSILAGIGGVIGTLYVREYLGRSGSARPRLPRGLAAGLGDLPRPERACSRSSRGRSCAGCCGGAGARASDSGASSSWAAATSAGWWRTGSSSTARWGSGSRASSTTARRRPTRSATAACRCSAPSTRSRRFAAQEKIDEIYVALPIDEHVKMLSVVEFASRECINIHVVPDLLQFIALRARLEDLDGLPIIGINDVPLRGINSVLKRAVDIAFSASVVLVGAIPTAIIAMLIKRSSPGPVFYRQQRMGLDGKAFTVYKFRSMPVDAEDVSGPDLGARRRPARDAHRPLAAPTRRRRAAAVLERAPGRHVDRRPASRAAVLRRAVQAQDPAIHASPQGEGGHHRLGAGQRLARQHVARKAHRVRPVLHRELVACRSTSRSSG